MALHSNEHNCAVDRTQPLPLMTNLDEHCAALQANKQSAPPAPEADDKTVLICTFEAPAAALLGADAREAEPASTDKHADIDEQKSVAAAPRASADPADLIQAQALELAANRAELVRQERAQEELQRAVRLRDSWLQDLRTELKAAKEERRKATAQLTEVQAQLDEMTSRVARRDARIAALEAEAAERMSLTAFAEEHRSRAPARTALPEIDAPSALEPLDHDAPPILLNRKVMSVGRTRDQDVCVPSALVSRDHARMLVSEEAVVLFDVGSINGCFINDALVKKQVLREGDIVRFADCRYRYSRRGAA